MRSNTIGRPATAEDRCYTTFAIVKVRLVFHIAAVVGKARSAVLREQINKVVILDRLALRFLSEG